MVRARGVGTLVSAIILVTLTAVGMRSCSQTTPDSPVNPGNIARSGIAGVCADAQAVQDAGGADPAPDASAITSDQLAELQRTNPAAVAALTQAAGSLQCPQDAGTPSASAP